MRLRLLVEHWFWRKNSLCCLIRLIVHASRSVWLCTHLDPFDCARISCFFCWYNSRANKPVCIVICVKTPLSKHVYTYRFVWFTFFFSFFLFVLGGVCFTSYTLVKPPFVRMRKDTDTQWKSLCIKWCSNNSAFLRRLVGWWTLLVDLHPPPIKM